VPKLNDRGRTVTFLSKKLLVIAAMLVGSVVLTACSSKPSPWSESESESSSPWEARAEQTAEPEPLSIEELDPPYQVEEEPIEPAGFVAAEDGSPMSGSEMAMEEPVVDEPVIEEVANTPVALSGSLAAQPADMFAVQVVASSSMNQLNFFASQNNLSDEWVAETLVDGKTWFVLMAGVYATKGEAEQALSGLQELGTDPWIRSVGSVQAVMTQ